MNLLSNLEQSGDAMEVSYLGESSSMSFLTNIMRFLYAA